VQEREPETRLARRLGTTDAVILGLGSMIGAGVFTVFAPAAAAAGSGLLIGVVVAGAVAYANATSSAQLAVLYPVAGGTYVFGRERLGPFWGFLAGWGFLVGKLASCTVAVLTVGRYMAPSLARPVAVAVALLLTALNYAGVRKTLLATAVLVALVLASLAAIVAGSFLGGAAEPGRLVSGWKVTDVRGVLNAAGLLFFAFTGYARVATLGEEVRSPTRTIPRAIPLALGVTLVVYLIVGTAALVTLGPARLARSATPLADALGTGTWDHLIPVARTGAVLAAGGVLVSLLAAVSRTAFAMAAGGDLPKWLNAVHPRFRVPHRAEIAAGAVVAILAGTVALPDALEFSSFTVLAYYAITNAAALTMPRERRRWPRWVAIFGLIGCFVLAATLRAASALPGLGVLVLGAVVYVTRHRPGESQDRDHRSAW
jgi:basic amino acid/polyamine antiporter, APA family